jgi:hypothetical protein
LNTPNYFETTIAETDWGVQKISPRSTKDMNSVIASPPKKPVITAASGGCQAELVML